ncbi:MAG: T9SS type A sorting domain-containing protein [candidate division Zixibacteria bacterium]|nr:T9SS type A sorting domain-containing protein [candidate division Zixibacteria bacterium]
MRKILPVLLLLLYSSTAFAGTHNAFASIENIGGDTIMVVYRSASNHIASDGNIVAYRGHYTQFEDTLNTYVLFESPDSLDYRDPSIRIIDDVLIIVFDVVDYITGRNDIFLSRSDDNGISWSKFENVTGDKTESHRWWTSTEIVATSQGTWIIPTYRWEPDSLVWSAGIIRSSDKGITWGDYIPVVYGTPNEKAPSEPSVVELNDGSLFILIREDNLNFNQYYSYSFDDGKNWMEAQLWFEPGVAPWVGKDVDGRIIASYGACGPWGVALTKSVNSGYPLQWGDAPRVVPYTIPATYTYPSLCKIESLSSEDSTCYFMVHNIERDHTTGNIGHILTFLPRYQVSGIKENETLPLQITVSSYPNPFNAVNSLNIEINEDSHLKVSVLNVLGQKVITLFDGIGNKGVNSIVWNAESTPSGVYFYSIRIGSETISRKITLLK